MVTKEDTFQPCDLFGSRVLNLIDSLLHKYWAFERGTVYCEHGDGKE